MFIKKNIINYFLLSFVFFGMTGAAHLYSQYILDDEEPKTEEKKEVRPEPKRAGGSLEKNKITPEKKEAIKEIKKPDVAKKKEPPIRQTPTTIDKDSVDEILKRTFMKGLYKEAIKELQNFVFHSDNKREISKARLFIARSHIEMDEYSKALDILISIDVKKYFPRDADFWEGFALLHIKNH